jgi:hypothetical protein
MKNSPHRRPANTKSKLRLLVPCLLTVLVVVLWLFIFFDSPPQDRTNRDPSMDHPTISLIELNA